MTKSTYNIIFVWLLLLNCFGVFAQDNLSIAQLRDSVRMYADSNPKKSLEFGLLLEHDLKASGKHPEELIKLKIRLARQSLLQNEFELATTKIQDAIILADLQNNDKLKAEAYKNLGNIYYQKEDYLSAIKYYSVSDSLANDKFHSLKIRFNYSGIKQRIGDYEEALDIRLRIYDELKNDNSLTAKRILANNILNILNIYKMLLIRDKKNKTYYLNKISEFYDIYKKLHSTNKIHNDIFYLTKYSIDLESAFNKDILRKIDSLQVSLNSLNIHSADEMIYYNKAKYYYILKNYNRALIELKRIDSIEQNGLQSSKYKDDIELLYAKVYKKLHKNGLALKKMSNANALLSKKERQRAEVSQVLRKQYDFNSINQKFNKLSAKEKTSNNSFSYWLLSLLIISMAIFIFSKLILEIKNDEIGSTLPKKEISLDEKLDDEQVSNKEIKEHKKNVVPKEVVEDVLKKLKQYERTNLFLSPDANLDSLAKYLDSNRVYTSKVLNDYLDTTFSVYINNLRIDYAIREINQNTDFRAMSIEAMSEYVGYKSKTTFLRFFKLKTGFTPYQYIIKAKKSSKSLKK